jgi:small GTP-binding protein
MSIVNIDYIFKITVIGNVCTGKTTLIEQLKYPSIKSDNEIYLSTIGVEYQTVMMKYEKEQKTIKLGIWDTSGDEIFASILGTYYNNISAIVAVFSSDKVDSFENVVEKIKYFREKYGNHPRILLIRNKNDLVNKISQEEINEVIRRYNCLYFSCNSLTGENVFQAFDTLKNNIYQTFLSSGLDDKFPGITMINKDVDSISPYYSCWDFLW